MKLLHIFVVIDCNFILIQIHFILIKILSVF